MDSHWLERLEELAVKFNCEHDLGLLNRSDLWDFYLYLSRLNRIKNG